MVGNGCAGPPKPFHLFRPEQALGGIRRTDGFLGPLTRMYGADSRAANPITNVAARKTTLFSDDETHVARRKVLMRSLGAQALALGLVDVVAIDVVPVVFGRGKPYFGARGDAPRMLEDPDVVIQGDRVLHLRYPVRR